MQRILPVVYILPTIIQDEFLVKYVRVYLHNVSLKLPFCQVLIGVKRIHDIKRNYKYMYPYNERKLLFHRCTAEDLFGRLENKHAFSAANAFQLDKLHSMSVFRNHHPLNWTLEEFKDVFSIAALWY